MNQVTAEVFDAELVQQMSEEDCAWLAAAIDFDGTVAVSKTYGYNIIVKLYNNDLAPRAYAKEITGVGTVKDSYWNVTNIADNLNILKQIEPFLILKRDLAKAAIIFLSGRVNKFKRLTDEDLRNWKAVEQLRRSNFGAEDVENRKLNGPVLQLTYRERNWLAAAIDFDGCISTGGTDISFSLYNSCGALLTYAIDITNIGSISRRTWLVCGHQNVYDVLIQIVPYLKCKQALAEAIIDYLTTRLPRHRKAFQTEDRIKWKRILKLRRRASKEVSR